MPKIKIIKKIFCLLPALFLLIFSCQNAEDIKTDYNITCYTATYGEGIYKSDNGGKSWYPMKKDQDDIHLYFKRLFLNPEKDTLYVATTGAGLFTVDLKKNTIQSIEQYKGQNVRTIAFTDNTERGSGILVGAFEDGISKVNAEKNSYMNDGLPEDYRVFDVRIKHISDDSDVVYAAGSKGIFMTVDTGDPEWSGENYGLPKTNITGIVLE